MKYALNMGESAVCSHEGEIVCYGLATCVGVFLYDKFGKVGAAAHVDLPDSANHGATSQMIQDMLEKMLLLGCNRLLIRASLVGAGAVWSRDAFAIGERNTACIKDMLRKAGILIKSEELGGNVSRTARLDVGTGVLSVHYPDKQFFTI